MSEARVAARSRSGDRQEDVRQALALTAGVLARHRAALATVAAALSGKDLPGAAALARRIAANPAMGAALRQLVETHARAAQVVNHHQQAYNAAMAKPLPAQRVLFLNAIPLPAIAQAGEAFLAQVKRWANDPDVGPLLRGPSTPGPLQRAAAAPKTGLLGKLAGATRPLAAPEPTEDPVQKAAATAIQRLKAGVDDARHVFSYNADRIAVVERGVAVHARPKEAPEAVCAGQPGKVVAVAAALASLYRERPPALQRSQVAVFQATDFRRELFKTDQELAQLALLPPARAMAGAQAYKLAPLRGKALPLTNFPRTFAGDPILCALFPPLPGGPA